MKRIFLLLAIAMICNVCLFAQGKITGTVVDKDNETIIGLYAKAGLDFEAGMFRMSAGYELIGTHTGYVRIGIKF